MADSKHEAYAHYVWATKRREPLIAVEWEPNLHALIASLADKAGCEVLAVNGMPDHIHLLVRESKTKLHWQVMQLVKGVSSQFISDRVRVGEIEGVATNWQGGYAVFTVSPGQVAGVTAYIEGQKVRHATGRVWASCEGDAIDGGVEMVRPRSFRTGP